MSRLPLLPTPGGGSSTRSTSLTSRSTSLRSSAHGSLSPLQLFPSQKQDLGYVPFEYWKGPDPVIPPKFRQVHSGNRTSQQRFSTNTTTTASTPTAGAPLPPAPAHLAAAHPTQLRNQQQQQQQEAPSFDAEKTQPTEIVLEMGYEGGPYPGAASSRGPPTFQVRDANGDVEILSGPPPAYNAGAQPAKGSGAWHDWRGWRKRTWAGIAFLVAAVVVAAVVAGVLVARANAYPDYTALTYSLTDSYNGTDFFDQFDYFTGYDPTSGFVHYVPQSQAESLNLTYTSSDSAVLRVDTSVGNTSTPDASTGRFSVRVTSKTQYDGGLFIFDVKHTPHGCGTWPALWLVDQANWPANGEIDVMEAVNRADAGNQMTLHTTSDCRMDVRRKETGAVVGRNCDEAVDDNAGCGVVAGDGAASYGAEWNAGGGGVMALEWRDAGIRMWQFARGDVPDDITSKTPDPSAWGRAAADFPATDCDVGAHFRNQSIVANIDLCGSWAGGVYGESTCPGSCTDFVANYPQNFTDAYWEFGAFEVYSAS